MAENVDDGRNLKVLEKGFEILEFISERPGMRLTDLSEELDMPKSTAHIYLQTLERAGYVVRRDSEYEVSFKFLTIGGLRRKQFPLYQAAKIPMAELAHEIDDVYNVALGTEQHGMRVTVFKITGTKSPYADVPDGHMTHLHWVPLGKALLSKFSEGKIESILERHGLPRATENTITTRSGLYEELDRIRDQGYALGDEERVEGIRAIGVPIEGRESDPYGSIAISGPRSRLRDDEIPRLVDELKATANITEIEYKNY
jgi:DNA-binding IclR family transcriptional regulator